MDEWNNKFPVSMQLQLCTNEISLGAIASLSDDECPSLALFKSVYGNKANGWICYQLNALNILNDTKDQMSDMQMSVLADDIMRRCYFLNLAEVCVFLGRFRMGVYEERFYANVDAQSIMRALKRYLAERIDEISKYEAAVRDAKRAKDREEWKKNAITYEEYKAQLERAKNGDEEIAKSMHYDPSREYGGLESALGQELIKK